MWVPVKFLSNFEKVGLLQTVVGERETWKGYKGIALDLFSKGAWMQYWSQQCRLFSKSVLLKHSDAAYRLMFW